MKVKVLILTGYGINAEKELAWAFKMAGGKPHILHMEDVIENKSLMRQYQILAFPGGFSFGDHIASGKVYGNLVRHHFLDEVRAFVSSEKLVIGICNGFQIITKMGLVPDLDGNQTQTVSLIENTSGRFEDRWVHLKVQPNNSPWLRNLDELYLPVRHGEGNFVVQSPELLYLLNQQHQIGLRYSHPQGKEVEYPYNPNGSVENIAGILNRKGNVFGLMPHPEAFIFPENHPNWTERMKPGPLGLEIFENGIEYFR
ncbi:MAG: phosphoribosylformylglycinamidine synthase I [Candidatus Aureabacteria bacterium]|nr:phosphoribosylformylglycinamidine synthase I [Candidatus Auribacterota bacterium]